MGACKLIMFNIGLHRSGAETNANGLPYYLTVGAPCHPIPLGCKYRAPRHILIAERRQPDSLSRGAGLHVPVMRRSPKLSAIPSILPLTSNFR